MTMTIGQKLKLIQKLVREKRQQQLKTNTKIKNIVQDEAYALYLKIISLESPSMSRNGVSH